MSSPSPIAALFSWLVVGMLAMLVLAGGLLWPEMEDWGDTMWPRPVTSGRRVVADPATGAGGTTGPSADTGEPELTDEEAYVAGLVPVGQVVDYADPEALLDELPAAGGAAGRPAAPKPKLRSATISMAQGEQDWHMHRVVPTETADQLAYRYGVRPESLRMWNGLGPDVQELRKGARLRVRPSKVPPPRQLHEYYVQPGDTWGSIGAAFGVDSRDLRRSNAASGRRLAVGQRIQMWIDPVVYLWASGEPDPHVPAGVRIGAVSVGPPQSGRLVNGVRLPKHPAYVLNLPGSAFGTTHAVAHVVHAMDLFRQQVGPRPALLIGSMSRRHGGPLPGHRSHQSGRDLDIRLPLRADLPQHMPIKPSQVDWVALWRLLEAFDATGQVRVVFLDYEMQGRLYKAAVALDVPEERRKEVLQWPRGHKAHLGFVRHSSGHQGHIHVRFSCGPNEPECVPDLDYDEDED